MCVCVYVLFVCAHACKRERITRSHHAILFAHNVVNVFLPPNVALIFSVRIETLWRTVENLSVSTNRSSSRKAPKQQQQHQLEKKNQNHLATRDGNCVLLLLLLVCSPLLPAIVWSSILCNISQQAASKQKIKYLTKVYVRAVYVHFAYTNQFKLNTFFGLN